MDALLGVLECLQHILLAWLGGPPGSLPLRALRAFSLWHVRTSLNSSHSSSLFFFWNV
jgi:hypothetical protein